MSSTKHEPLRGLRDYEARWEQAGACDAESREPLSVVENLDGDWKVERLSGPLPMPFVWKRIRGGRGMTLVSPPSLRNRAVPPAQLPFRLKQREGHVALIYVGPLSFLVDELRLEADGSWLGRASAAGVRYAWFRMVRRKAPTTPLADSHGAGERKSENRRL